MMLDWMGDRHDSAECRRAAALLTTAVERAFAAGTLIPVELGGTAGTADITARVQLQLERPDVADEADRVVPD